MRAIPALALAAVLFFPTGAAAEPKTGQSPGCKRFCMSVEPREGPEGSVFRIRGRSWRPNRRVEVVYGAYCRPDQACPAIAFLGHVRTGRTGGFTFRVRAGQPQPGDDERKITAGSGFTFSQRTVTRRPNYRVILPPECGDCG
ncbi:MAG TPA: hypothetical protein VF056_02900 [Thermoleophilaceae bacterium]